MNNIISKINVILIACTIIFMFSSCDKEDYTGYGTLSATDPTFTITWDTELPTSQTEGDASYPFTITLSEPQISDLKVQITPTDASTATIGKDFDVSSEIAIAAGRTEGSGELTIYRDLESEEDEIVAFEIGGASTANMSHSEVVTLNIEEGLLVAFDWDGIIDVTIGGTLYEGVGLCANVDIDVLVSDTPGGDIGDYTAATGACPEVYSFDGSTWQHGDGTFYFGVNLYGNGGVAPDDGPIPFPVTATIIGTGVFSSVEQDDSTILMSDNDGSTADPVLKVVVSGNSFSFYDPITDELIYSN